MGWRCLVINKEGIYCQQFWWGAEESEVDTCPCHTLLLHIPLPLTRHAVPFATRFPWAQNPRQDSNLVQVRAPSSLLCSLHYTEFTPNGVQLLWLYLLLLFVLVAIGWLVVSQGLTVQPTFISSSLFSCLSFWSDSRPDAHCSLQTHQNKLFRVFHTTGHIQQKKDHVSPLKSSSLMILFDVNFLGISCIPNCTFILI